MGNQTNYKEFREAFGAEAAFGYLEAGLTFDQANAAHALVTPLENKVKSLEGEKAQLQSDLDAANEQIKDFQNEKPLDPDNAIPPKDPKDEKEEPDPVADFEAKVVEQIPAGKEDDPDAKAAARNKAADANPELYEQYLAAYNQK